MLSKNEASKMRGDFWTTFGKLMSFVPSQWNPKINWVNYNTGVKHIQFKMNATNKSAYIGIELTYSDNGLRMLFFEQFKEFKRLLEEDLEETWNWELEHTNEGNQTISRIYTELNGKSIFREDDWQNLFSFFKQRIIALDNFWENAQDIFKDLSS